jgi:hypothetical protein
VAFGDVEREVVGQGVAGVVELGGPVEDVGEEAGEVVEASRGGAVVGAGGARDEALVRVEGLPTHALGLGEHGHGDHEPFDRLHEPEPFRVKAGLEVVAHRVSAGCCVARGRRADSRA